MGIEAGVVVVAIGLLMGLLGFGLSALRHRRHAKRLTANYERQVQLLQQAMTDRGQEVQTEKRAAARAAQRLAEQERHFQSQAEILRETTEELRRAQVDQERVHLLAQEIESARRDLTWANEQNLQLQEKAAHLEQVIAERNEELVQAKRVITASQGQVSRLETELQEQNATVATLQEERGREVTLRHSLATEIRTIAQRLQSGSSDTGGSNATTAAQSTVTHDAMDNTSAAPPVTDANTPEPITALPMPINPTTNGAGDRNVLEVPGSAGRLAEFLAERGITITQVAAEESFDPVLNGLASFLGTHYDSVKPLYQQIKRNMQLGDDFTLNLKEESPKTISLICQFGKKLYDVAFLEQYRYFRSPQYLLRAKTTRLPTAQNFFSGQWLERFVMQEVQEVVTALQAQTAQQIDFAYLANPRITLANEQEGELDFLFHVNGHIYWIETKSGDYQQHISKYAMIARTLELDEKHALMVLTDIPASRSAELTALFGMGVCALGEFKAHLFETVQQDLALRHSGS
ncbi:MAG: hypothetical protein KDE53_05690 [Caldilineaceae bacterium]|nr:hypothetical protein [Caldilineaceae bacterium]